MMVESTTVKRQGTVPHHLEQIFGTVSRQDLPTDARIDAAQCFQIFDTDAAAGHPERVCLERLLALDVRTAATPHHLLFHLQITRTQRQQSGRLAAERELRRR